MKKFYSPREISEGTGMPLRSTYRYLKKGLIPSYKIGKHYRVSENDFEEFLETSRTSNSTEVSEA